MLKLQKSSDEIYREPGKPAWLKDCILNGSGKPLPKSRERPDGVAGRPAELICL